MKKRILPMLLALCMVVALCPAKAQAAAEGTDLFGGYCGEELTWTNFFGKVSVRGTGDMYDYEDADEALQKHWYAVQNAWGVKSVEVYEGVASIGSGAFQDRTDLKKVSFRNADSLTRIGKNAFSGCTALEEVIFYGWSTQWNEIVIEEGNECLTNATITFRPLGNPDKGGQCGDNVSWGWYEDEETMVITGNGNMWDFEKNDKDQGASYPYSLTNAPWENTSGFIASNRAVGRVKVTSTGLLTIRSTRLNSTVTIGEGVTDIGTYAFYKWGFESLKLPDSITRIGSSAFEGCNMMTEIWLPSSLTEVASDAFKNCSALERVYFDGTTKEWNALQIDEGNEALANATVYCMANLTVEGGSIVGGGTQRKCFVGEPVTVTIDAAPAEQYFSGWAVSGGYSLDYTDGGVTSETITFLMPDRDLTLSAQYADVEYYLTVEGGTGEGMYPEGSIVTVTAVVPAGQQFAEWKGNIRNLTLIEGDVNSETITFAMPDRDIYLVAGYGEKLYTLTVEGGIGGGQYKVGEQVTITVAGVPEGQRFEKWVGDLDSLGVDESTTYYQVFTFTMPDCDVSLQATYKNAAVYEVAVTNALDGSVTTKTYNAGDVVFLVADAAPSGKRFKSWSGSIQSEDMISGTMRDRMIAFIMPAHNVELHTSYAIKR